MSDEQNEKRPEPQNGLVPPLIDLTGRAAPTPGPLTKPSPTISPRKRRPRWVKSLVMALVLVALAGGVIALYVAL